MELVASHLEGLKERLAQKAKVYGKANSNRATAIHEFYLALAPGYRQYKGAKYNDKVFKSLLAQKLAYLKDIDDLRYLYFKCKRANSFSKCFWWHVSGK